MANTLRFKRGLVAGIPTGVAGEPLFTTDTFDLYIGNGTTNTRFQKYIASGTTAQYLRGDGSLATFPTDIVTGTGVSGQVAYWSGTNTQVGSNNLFWDATNSRLGIGTNGPSQKLHVVGAILNTAGFVLNRSDGYGFFTGASDDFGIYHDGTDSILSNATGNIIFTNIGIQRARITSGGNFIINNPSTDSGQRLQVTGDTLMKGSGNTSATTALTVQNSDATNMFRVRNDGYALVNSGHAIGSALANYIVASDASNSTSAAGLNLNLLFGSNTTAGFGLSIFGFNTSTRTATSGTSGTLSVVHGFAPTSGTGTFIMVNVGGTINQTGGANGITRGLYVNPTLTAAADWRSIEWSNNTGWGLYGAGTANNYLAGSLGIGITTPSTDLHISKAGSRSLRLTNSTNSTDVELGIATALGTVGTNTANAFAIVTSNTERMRITPTTGNVHIGTFVSDTGEKLQVTGTMKVTGASTFGDNSTISKNYNGETKLTISNTTTGDSSVTYISLVSSNGLLNIGKRSSTVGVYKFLAVNDSQIFNNTSGDIAILNDFASGSIKMAAGASSTAHFTIASTGAATFSSTIRATNLGIGRDADLQTNYGVISNGGTSGSFYRAYAGSTETFRIQATSTTTNVQAFGGDLRIDTGATNYAMLLASGGNVGIGITIPSQKLHVTGNLLLGSTASTIGAINLILTGTSPVASRLTFGTDGTGYSFAIAKNQATVITDLFTILDSGAANFTTSIQAGTAIAIGTTPDTNKPFKILKNINATVGINFENTSTGSSAFSAIQMGTDVTGGTAFTNLVYGSSGISEAGVYKPSGTSLVNTGAGGLNFLAVSQPIRFFTSSGNGTLRASITNDGDYTQFNGTNPSASTTDAFRMYSADVVAGNAAPHFRTENGAVIKLYQETTGVGNAIFSAGGGTGVLDDSTFDGYTLRQIVKALRNQGILA